jgi:hypothetical protein
MRLSMSFLALARANAGCQWAGPDTCGRRNHSNRHAANVGCQWAGTDTGSDVGIDFIPE